MDSPGDQLQVVSLVGPSGCGKSSLTHELARTGVATLSEDYLASFPPEFSNRELLSKWPWIAQWIQRVWDIKRTGESFLVADRCPIEVVPYACEGLLLLEPLRATFTELRTHGLSIHTLYLRVSLDVCLERCKTRLGDQPVREGYGELDVE